jgi:hypothetical protein
MREPSPFAQASREGSGRARRHRLSEYGPPSETRASRRRFRLVSAICSRLIGMLSRTGAVSTVAEPGVACNTTRCVFSQETPSQGDPDASLCAHMSRLPARLFGVGRRPRPARGDVSPLWADPAESATNLPNDKPSKRNRPLGSLVVGLWLTLNEKAGRPLVMSDTGSASFLSTATPRVVDATFGRSGGDPIWIPAFSSERLLGSAAGSLDP